MRCAACGTENPERAKFCLECGSALAEAPGVAHESRRTVTIVFADMVGFTSLGESLDQESLRRVMDRFYAEMRGAIEAEAGTLAKFIGDAVLAVWGTPEVREDDALRAVRAADAMRRALASLNEDLQERWGVRVGMRTGVNTGEVVVDPTRPADLLVGDALNVAARLEQAAADGEVLLGPDTYRLVRHETTLEPVAPLELKGKTKPMPAWRVVDARMRERRADARLQAPLIGRSAELTALWSAFTAVARDRTCSMTTVIGSPGLGKTRLVSEFVRSVADQAIVLHGRCQATGEGITFQPVAEVLRGAARIDDDDTPDAAREKLGRVLPADEPDRERIIERAAGLLGLAAVASTEETFWAVRRILEALSRERPVVLVHDDIHWGQPTFLDLLEHFVQWIDDAPVFVLALARPELRESRPALAEPGGVADVIALEPLDEEGSRALVDGLLGAADLPPGLAERVLETTEGNPLFLGETLRMLADEGVLRREGDTWVAGDVGDVIVPPTINALLSARIERLDSDERSVVERAAVIGHAFYRGAVSELAPLAVKPGVDAALATLSRKEMVRAEDEWWLDEQVFRFHHVLIRDAAYRSLLKEARAVLHERFAAWLETKAGELAGEHEEVIAFHLEQAHSYRLELGPLDEAGRALAARAAARLHSAGRRALAREDLPAAVNLLKRALTPMADAAAGRLEVLVDLAETLLSAGDTGVAEQVVEELGLGADELGDDRLRARAVVFACQLDNLTGAGSVRRTADMATAAAAALAAVDDRAGEAKAHQVVAQAEALLGQVAAAEAALDRALVAARAADDRRRITAVLSGAPRAALWGPAPIVRASGRCLDVVRILRMTPGNRHVEAAALRSQAVLEAMRGRADAARGILDSCRTTLEELGLTLELHETAIHAGIVELLAGEPAAAEAHLRAAHDGFRTLGVESGAAQAAALLARALLEQGADDAALEFTRFAEEHGGEDLKTTVTWLGVRAEVLSRRGEHDKARALARRATDLTQPTDALADKADALMTLAAVEAAAGNGAAEQAAAGSARELYAAKDHSVGMARAEAVAGIAAPAAAAPAAGPRADRTGLAILTRRDRFVELSAQRDFETMREFYATDFLMVDTRQIGWEPGDRDAFIANNRAVLDIGADCEVMTRTLAADEGIIADVLTFAGTSDEGAQWTNTFGIVEVGVSAAVYAEVWDPDDEAAMLARFEELRPLGPTAVSGRSPEVAMARITLAYNRRDWDTLRAVYSEDFAMVDRRQMAWEGVRGGDAFMEFLKTTVEPFPDTVFRVTRVLARTDRAIAVTTVNAVTERDGAESVIPLGQVALLDDDGRFACVEFFDPDDEAGMLARFRELMDEREAPQMTPLQRVSGRAWGEAFTARDWERLGRFYAPDVILRDHRQGIRNEARGREAVMATLAEAAPINGTVIRWEPLARPADNILVVDHALGGETDAEGGHWEMVLDQVIVYDADERVALVEIFDDREALIARGEELAEDPLPPLVLRVAARFVAAFDGRDWDALEACFDPGGWVDDRRAGVVAVPGGRMQGAMADIVRSYAELGSDVTWKFEPLAHAGERCCVIDNTIAGTDATGGAFEMCLVNAIMCDEEGRQSRLVAVDEVDAAYAVMDAWAREDALHLAPWVEHGAGTELLDRWIRAFNEHEVDGLEALGAPEILTADRWSGMPDVRVEAFVLQSADEILHARLFFRSRSSAYEIGIEIVTVSPVGLTASNGVFELGNPSAAERFAELTRDEPLTVTLARRWEDAFNTRDWERAACDQSATFASDDRRPLGGGLVEGGPEGIEMSRAMIEVAPDIRWRFEPIEANDDAGLFRTSIEGHGADGGPFSVTTLQVLVAGRDRKTARNVTFDVDQESEAWADFRAWTAHLRQARFQDELLSSGDLDRVRDEMYAPGFTQTDYRATGAPVLDVDGMVASLREAYAMAPDSRAEAEVVAVSGARRVQRLTYRGHLSAGGGEVELELWTLTTIDGLRNAGSDIYPSREDALEALRAGREHPFEAVCRERAAAVAARDLDKLGALMADDVEWVGHRAGSGEHVRGRAEAMRSMSQILVPAITDVRLDWELLEIVGPRRGLVRERWIGTYEGGPFEVGFLCVRELDEHGLTVRDDAFDIDQMDEARACLGAATSEAEAYATETEVVTRCDDDARTHLGHLFEPGDPAARELFAELSAEDRGDRVLHGMAFWADALNCHDFERFAACLAAGYRVDDNRPLVRHSQGREASLEMWRRSLESTPDLRVDYEVFATAGDVALARFRWSGREGSYEIEMDAVLVVDDQDRIVHTLAWKTGDPAAREAYEALAGNLAARHARERVAAFNARDWNALADTYAADCGYDDERTALRQDMDAGREGAIAVWRAVAVSPDASVTCEIVGTDGPRRAAVRYCIAATYRGGPYEMVYAEALETDAEGRAWRGLVLDDAPDEALMERLRAWHPTCPSSASGKRTCGRSTPATGRRSKPG